MCIHIFLFHHLNEWESEWMKINLELSNFMETIFFFSKWSGYAITSFRYFRELSL